MHKQKSIGIITLLIMLVTQSFANWVFFSGGTVEAAGPVEETKLVALFVEQSLYPSIRNNVQRYSLQYIQSRFPRTKVLVLPVDTTTIQSTDIQKILSNLYHGGEKDTASTLVGTILVGNIPLPVVKNNEYIFPTVIPYTDIEKPAYVYNTADGYFEPSSAPTDSIQELFHGVIKFDNNEKYNAYFEKLKSYVNNPKSFANQTFWFEDIAKAEETFTTQNVPSYILGQVFDEDLSYHRYAPVLFNLLQQKNNNGAINILEDIGNINTAPQVNDEYSEDFNNQTKEYNDGISSWKGALAKAAQDGQQNLSQAGGGEQIPTLMLGQSTTQQTKPYESFFSAEYGDMIAKEIETSARWTSTGVSSHILKASATDQLASRTLVGLNTILENTIDKKIKDDNMALHVPIPVVREKYKCLLGVPILPPEYDYKDEVFYFGKNARDITNAGETTWYRGTFANYSTVGAANSVGRGGAVLDTTDSNARSVGATFGITSQQVVASRGYNTLNSKKDADAYQYWRKHCGTNFSANVSFEDYVKQYRGGHTPMNLDGDTLQLKSDTWDQAFNPSYDKNVGGPLFDLAGSRLVQSAQAAGTNVTAANTYGRFLQTEPGLPGPLGLLFGSQHYPRCNDKNPIPVSQYNYFQKMAAGGAGVSVVPYGATNYTSVPTCSERVFYKTIDSVVKHTSPTQPEVDKMNMTTKDRPIDAKRYVTFQGYAGNVINLQYPNLYNVEVYNRDGNVLTLKSVADIKDSIIAYLQNKVGEYNTTLSAENSQNAAHVASNNAAYTALSQADGQASAIGKQYNTLPSDFLIQAIGMKAIEQLAQNLYLKNSAWPTRLATANVGDTVKNLEDSFSVTNKLFATLENQLVVGQQGLNVNTAGYEAGYIRTNGSNTIKPVEIPTVIQDANTTLQNSKTSSESTTTANKTQQKQAKIDQECSVGSDGTVPLLKRPKAVACRWKNLKKNIKNTIKITYKDAQGPVLSFPQFKDVLQESYTNYSTYVNDMLGVELGESTTVSSISLELPTTKVIRGAQLPFSISAKNSKGENISNLLFPIEVTTDTGDLLTIGQGTTRLQTTNTEESILLDTRTISPSVSNLKLTIRGPIEPGKTTTSQQTKDITIVDGTLQVLSNNTPTSNISLQLNNDGYYTLNNGLSSVRTELLPTITLRLVDSNNEPLTSLATVTSTNGMIQPGYVETLKDADTNKNYLQFTQQNLWTLENGTATIKLMPNMRAGSDTVTISVPGLPDRSINVTVNPGSPYAVSVSENTQSGTPSVRLSVQDKRKNTISTPTPVQYSIMGDATSNGNISGIITVAGSTTLPITYGSKGGAVYIYGSLGGNDKQPGYIRKDLPTNIIPQGGLNVVYLTYEGKDRGNIHTNTIPTMISSSPKLITVTSKLYDTASLYPVQGVISRDGNISAGSSMKIENNSGISVISQEEVMQGPLQPGINKTPTNRRNIIINNRPVGYISGGGKNITLENFVIQDSRYKVVPSWDGGSTNKNGFAIIDTAGQIAESFAQDFSPIRSYAGGVTVGEAQKQIFNEDRINYGDPYLQHADATKTIESSKDTTVTIFRDDSKTIKKVMEMDIDKDGRKDLVTLYDDDTIRFLKQYGGSKPYTQLGNLMAVTDGVQDMWIGDGDNNGLEDLFIRTKKNTLRIYKNLAGSFDVNGMPVCIDVPSGNTSLENVWQIFIDDMNNDKVADIITYDVSGKIRIFHGGVKNGNGYYISTSPTGCDKGRQSRNTGITVATYGLQIKQNIKIYDDSLVHWKGLTIPTDDDYLDDSDDDSVPAAFANSFPDPSNPESINVEGLINSGIPETIRFSSSPLDRLPTYETNGSLDTIAYVPVKHLENNDIIQSSKTFAYNAKNDVIVTVSLTAKTSTIATYLEQLRGPWEVIKEDDGSITNFSRGSLPASSIVDWQIDNGFMFMVDNIPLSAGQTVTFSYPVRYKATKTTTIGISDTNKDGWLDITTTPVDSCINTTVNYISNNGKSYASTPTTVSTSYTGGLADVQDEVTDQINDINEASQKVEDGTAEIKDIPGIDQALEKRFEFDANNMTANANFDLNVLNDPKIEKAIDDAVKGLCQGFTAGGKGGGGEVSGPPVPFNMAFLSPGTYNIFGCKLTQDKGLPAFFFPGTLQTSVGPVPIPYGLKGAGDGFYRAQGGVYPSQIRIYVSPTLTMGVGIAICIGPYAAGIKLPNPIRHIAGNCIVIAKPFKGIPKRANKTPGHPQAAVEAGNDNGGNTSRTCSNPAPDPSKPSSPFVSNAYNGSKDLPLTPGPAAGNTPGLGIQQGTYLGMIEFDTQPYATQLSQEAADKAQLKGGKAIKLQIEGGNVKGLIKCVINKWLDNQVRYLINNLTNMSINITLPDVSQLAQGFKNVRLDELSAVAETFKKNPSTGKTPAGNVLKNLVTKTQGEQLPVSKSDVSELGSIMNNPFNALAGWFEQVPLIRVSTRNVTVQIPFIYSEELTRYTAMMQNYIKDLDQSVDEWDKLIKDVTGQCDKETTPNQKEACNQKLAEYASANLKVQQLQRSLKQNMQTLQAYKRFPLELQQWLTVSQRYISEVTDTVQGISNDITYWLNTNAKRFEKYVDVIILMIGAIKSWQAIIDFSVSWKSKCGQCKVDNYDYYSCTLGLLCPKLPILAIPPFKLPNIYVDLSHIRLGMDVVLPNIHFVPKSITLPALPEIPRPPTVNINLTASVGKIPAIPQLPAPPKLPELPSFIPSIELNLPTLPPAPKVPRLAPAIQTTLKVASVIAKILCIVKNGIGLVGEKGVKTRIEQLTQRTWNVFPFDALSITKITPPLRGFDIRVESFLNFELNFEVLYDTLAKLAKEINKKSNTLLSNVNSQINNVSSASNSISEQGQNQVDKGNINTQGNLTPKGIQGYNEPELVDPEVLRKDLTTEITALQNSEYAEEYKTHIATVNDIIHQDTAIKPNIESVQNATKALEGMLRQTSEGLEKHKQAIDSYDSFLDQVNSELLVSDDNIRGDISASLFTANPKTIDTIKGAEHPFTSYLNLQEKIANGFAQALETHSPDGLNMSYFSHNRLQNFFHETQDKIQEAKGYVQPSAPAEEENTPISNILDGVQTVIAPSVQAAETVEMSPTNAVDIRWDDHSIYTTQKNLLTKKNDNSRYTRYYEFDAISKYSDLAAKADEYGYIKRFNSSFNLRNQVSPITSFRVEGQSNTSTNVSRQNNQQAAYLIMLDDVIYANKEVNYSKAVSRKYVLVYANGNDMSNQFLTIPKVGTKRVSDFMGSTIIQSIAYDPAEDDISVMLKLGGDRWSYANIIPLITTSKGNTKTWKVGSAWSAQETLGVQRRGDTTPPVAVGRIRDRVTGKFIAEGISLTVPRKGYYDLVVQWTDDGVIQENTLTNKSNSKTYEGDTATVENLVTVENMRINATARDQSNNIGNQNITIQFEDPTINIDSVYQQLDEREIGASLSQIYPDGYVRFYNQRSSNAYALTGVKDGKNIANFDTTTMSPSLTGRVFYDADTISLFTNTQERIARIEKKNGRITMSSERTDRINLVLDMTQNIPNLLFISKDSKETLFSLYLKSKSLQKVDLLNNYTSQEVDASMGTFGGGTCIQDTIGTCVVYVTTDGNIYSPSNQKNRVGGYYGYNNGVSYTLTIDGTEAAKVTFTPTSLE